MRNHIWSLSFWVRWLMRTLHGWNDVKVCEEEIWLGYILLLKKRSWISQLMEIQDFPISVVKYWTRPVGWETIVTHRRWGIASDVFSYANKFGNIYMLNCILSLCRPSLFFIYWVFYTLNPWERKCRGSIFSAVDLWTVPRWPLHIFIWMLIGAVLGTHLYKQ